MWGIACMSLNVLSDYMGMVIYATAHLLHDLPGHLIVTIILLPSVHH